MECVYCHKPIERSIEGEPVCSRCWARRQQTEEERAQDREIERWIKQRRRTDQAVCGGTRRPGYR